MENCTQSGGNLPPPAPKYRTLTAIPTPSAKPPSKTLSISLKHWLGGMVNNPIDGTISHTKVWSNVVGGVFTWQMLQYPPTEWMWWAYGGMVGGYSLARRTIAAVQQAKQKGE